MYCPVHTPTAVVLSRQKDISLVVGLITSSSAVTGKIRNVYGCWAAMGSGVMGLYTGSSGGNLR
jgi:hypothetical protein